MTNETKTFNITTIHKLDVIVEVATGKLLTISGINKRGRWHYISVADHMGAQPDTIEYSEGKFFAQFAEYKAPKAPKAPKVKVVSDAVLEDAMIGVDIAEGRPTRARREAHTNIEISFDRFRQSHRSQVVEVGGRQVRTQGVGDDVAAGLLEAEVELGSFWKAPLVVNNLDVAALQAKYAHLNNGMQRMNVGNILRGMLRKAARESGTATK